VNNRDNPDQLSGGDHCRPITMLASMGRWAMIFGGMEVATADRRGRWRRVGLC